MKPTKSTTQTQRPIEPTKPTELPVETVAAPVVPAPVVPAPAPVESSALVAPTPAASSLVETTAPVPAPSVSSEFAARKALALSLPERLRPQVMALKRPSSVDLMNLVLALPEVQQEAMMRLVAKTSSTKLGIHTASNGFTPTALKINQGIGDDPTKPANCVPGDYYSADSRILGKEVVAVPLGVHMGHTLWAPRDQGKKPPICTSADRITGSKLGECAACPLNPTKRQYTDGGCTREVVVYLLDVNMTAIYSLGFARTSEPAGRTLAKTLEQSSAAWARWFTFGSSSTVNKKGQKYLVMTALPVADAAKANTDPALHPLFEALASILEMDVYYPEIATIHARLRGEEVMVNPPEDAATAGAPLASDTKAAPNYDVDF